MKLCSSEIPAICITVGTSVVSEAAYTQLYNPLKYCGWPGFHRLHIRQLQETRSRVAMHYWECGAATHIAVVKVWPFGHVIWKVGYHRYMGTDKGSALQWPIHYMSSLVLMFLGHQLFKLCDQKAWEESGNKAIHVLVAVDMQVMMIYRSTL